MDYTLEKNGDNHEMKANKLFLKIDMPSYEKFWLEVVVPLTGRPQNIHFKSDINLKFLARDEELLYIHEKICIAQLHYSVLRFMLEAFEAIDDSNKELSNVEKCFHSLYSALDISAELFIRWARIKNKTIFSIDAFTFASIDDSKTLRKKWIKEHPFPEEIKKIRNYRNILVHGRLLPMVQDAYVNFIYLPRLGSEHLYFDWRNIANDNINYSNLIFGKTLTSESFKTTVKFLEECWRKYLL